MSDRHITTFIYIFGDIFLILMSTLAIFILNHAPLGARPLILYAFTSCIYGVILYTAFMILYRTIELYKDICIRYRGIGAALLVILVGSFDIFDSNTVLPELGLTIAGVILLVINLRDLVVLKVNVPDLIIRIRNDLLHSPAPDH